LSLPSKIGVLHDSLLDLADIEHGDSLVLFELVAKKALFVLVQLEGGMGFLVDDAQAMLFSFAALQRLLEFEDALLGLSFELRPLGTVFHLAGCGHDEIVVT
jgi:hypothetical protein